VLNDVQRRRFLVEPAGEHAVPASVRFLHIDLDERSGELLCLPWSGRLACPEAHEQILPARRLTGVKSDRLHDAVALVEDAEHGDPLRHRRDTALPGGSRRYVGGRRPRRILLLLTSAARGQRAEKQQWCGGKRFHVYSGIQGS
jgi:hypothetical protein